MIAIQRHRKILMMFGLRSQEDNKLARIDELTNVGTLVSTDAILILRAGANVLANLDAIDNIVIGGTTPVAGSFSTLGVTTGQINIATSSTPASATATGTTGDIAWDSDYIYVCVATDTWKRTSIQTWNQP
jgi:ribose/xylose/arabinose/galactoside ABC-type transport system permease subunit